MFDAPSPAEWSAVILSLQVALAATAGAFPLGLFVAWALARWSFPGKAVLSAVITLPLVVPPVVVGYGLLILFGRNGTFGEALAAIGIALPFSWGGAAVAAAVMGFPLMVRAMRLSMDAIDPGLEFAARTLGANRLDVFLTISLPLMVPGIFAGFIIAYAASLGEFGATITFAANVVGETRTLPLAIYSAIQTPDGDLLAMRLVILSSILAVVALALSEFVEQWSRSLVYGR